MKRFSLMAFFSVGASIVLISCNQNYSLNTPNAPPGGSGGGSNASGPLIQAMAGLQYDSAQTVISAMALLHNPQMTPIPVATVVLNTPSSGSIPLTAVGSLPGSFMAAQNMYTWQTGATYTYQINIAGTSYSAAMKLPGNIYVPSHAGQITWNDYGYNLNMIALNEVSPSIAATSFGPQLSSPFTPTFMGNGTYTTVVNLNQMEFNYTYSGVFNNAYPASYFQATVMDSGVTILVP